MLHLLPATTPSVHCFRLLSPVCEGNLGIWNMVLPEPWLGGEQAGLASRRLPSSSLLPRGCVTSGDPSLPCFAFPLLLVPHAVPTATSFLWQSGHMEAGGWHLILLGSCFFMWLV